MRVLAIGDIHGCLGPLDALLDWVAPAADDLVVTLGDYVDRGPDTRGVLDRLVGLKRAGRRLVCLRGNHEVMMLAAREGRGDLRMWLSVGGVQALASYVAGHELRANALDAIPADHWAFLECGLVPHFETDTHLFVHAGVLCGFDLAEQNEEALYWAFLPEAMRHHSGKMVICGHTSQKTGDPKVIPGAVCIDTYCHGGGWLTCLDAATGHYWQANLRGDRREGRVEYGG
ncbi:MAG: serine/threonine protein phosphatase [Gemmataceae bacterium]|nr:serine/threonine protein phosphatase [Gemmataceae bacterium]